MARLLLRKIGKSYGPVRVIEALSLNGDLRAFDGQHRAAQLTTASKSKPRNALLAAALRD